MRLSEYQVESQKNIDRFQFNRVIEEESLCGMATELGRLNSCYLEKTSYPDSEVEELHKQRCVAGILYYLSEYCTAHDWSMEKIAEDDLINRREIR